MADDPELNRRDFLKVTGGAALASTAGCLSGDDTGPAAFLIGPDANKPAPGDGFFENKTSYRYLYFATDTGVRYKITTEDSTWTAAAFGGGNDTRPVDELPVGGVAAAFEPSSEEFVLRSRPGEQEGYEARVSGTQVLSRVNVIESFERTNALADYAGDTGSYTIDSTGAFDGDNYLATTDGGFSRIRNTTSSDTPKAGDTFAFQIRIDGDTDHRIRFGVQDRDNNYGVRVEDGNMSIYERINGVFSEYTRVSQIVPKNEWLRGDIDWSTNGTITFTLFNASGNLIREISATDTQFTDGSIGFSHNDGGDDRIDFVRYV